MCFRCPESNNFTSSNTVHNIRNIIWVLPRGGRILTRFGFVQQNKGSVAESAKSLTLSDLEDMYALIGSLLRLSSCNASKYTDDPLENVWPSNPS